MYFSQLAIVAAIFVHRKSRQRRIWILDFQKTNSDFEKNKLRFSKKNKLQFKKKQTPIFEKTNSDFQ